MHSDTDYTLDPETGIVTFKASLYSCFSCGKDVVDCVYLVPRRRIRPMVELLPSGVEVHHPLDAVDNHAGIIVGPENDPHCQACYENLPDIQELIDAHKKAVNNAG